MKKFLRLSLVLILFIGLVNFGATCLPVSDNTTSSDTGTSGNTGGTTGSTTGGATGGTTNNVTGEWNGTYQETSNNMQGPLVSGILHFVFNQNTNSSFSGNGYFKENGMLMQVPFNSFNNGVVTNTGVSFSIENTAGNTGGLDKIYFNGTLNTNIINGTFERNISAPGKTTVTIKGTFSIQSGGTTSTGTATVNITGTWEGTYNDTTASNGQLNSGIISFNFTQTGNNISGNGINSTMNGTYTVTGGTVNGNNVNFSMTEKSNNPNNPWTSTIFDFGVVNGNVMTGTYEANTNIQFPPQTIYAKGNFTLNKK